MRARAHGVVVKLVLSLSLLAAGSGSSNLASGFASSAAAADYGVTLHGWGAVEFPHHQIMALGEVMTYEYWARGEATAEGQIEFYKGTRDDHKSLLLRTDGSVNFIYSYDPWPWVSSAPGAFPLDGAWHHVAVSRRADKSWTIYVDGQVVAAGVGPAGNPIFDRVIDYPGTVSGIRFGTYAEPVPPSRGWSVRELRVSSAARYDGSFTPEWTFAVDSSTAMLVHFDEGSGNRVQDSGPAAQVGSFVSYGTGFVDWVQVDPVPSPIPITMGTSWDGIPLQQILDKEYGPGAINVETDYEGYRAGDGDPAWWQDLGVRSLLVREIASNASSNRFGWHAEDLTGLPAIDGIDDGIIFDGPVVAGSEVLIEFPSNLRFGFYLDPNGSSGTCNAPEPEMFFTNRFYNDIGPDGSGAIHAPFDGDVQCLIFNITHLRGGVPTYVLAWEDLDSGSEVTEAFWECGTDNDYNDLVVEISAFSPVKVESGSWGQLKARYEE